MWSAFGQRERINESSLFGIGMEDLLENPLPMASRSMENPKIANSTLDEGLGACLGGGGEFLA